MAASKLLSRAAAVTVRLADLSAASLGILCGPPEHTLALFVVVYRFATFRADILVIALSATGLSRFTQCDYLSRVDYLYSTFKSVLSTSALSRASTISIISAENQEARQ